MSQGQRSREMQQLPPPPSTRASSQPSAAMWTWRWSPQLSCLCRRTRCG